jgi:hypothetical protein
MFVAFGGIVAFLPFLIMGGILHLPLYLLIGCPIIAYIYNLIICFLLAAFMFFVTKNTYDDTGGEGLSGLVLILQGMLTVGLPFIGIFGMNLGHVFNASFFNEWIFHS